MSRREALTDAFVKGFADVPAKGGRLYVYDQSERGLHLAVTQTGVKSFWWQGRIAGRPERIPLGRYPETTVKAAKARCLLVRAAIEQGRDPRAELAVSRRRRGVISLRDFFDIWLDTYARQNRAGHIEDAKVFDRYLMSFSDRPLQSITADQVRVWHAALGTSSGPSAANKAAGLLSSLYAKAMAWDAPAGGRYATSNPATATVVSRFREDERDRYLSRDEVGRLWAVLQAHEVASARHFFILAMVTAQRKTTLMEMRYEDIDRDHWIWVVPRLKGGKRNHPVPLVGLAKHIIEVRREFSRSPWVFPGYKRGGDHIKNVNGWWKEVREKADIEDVTIHDLRRTLASWMAMTGAPYQVIAQLLAHRLPGPTAIYARLDVEPVRRAILIALEGMGIPDG